MPDDDASARLYAAWAARGEFDGAVRVAAGLDDLDRQVRHHADDLPFALFAARAAARRAYVVARDRSPEDCLLRLMVVAAAPPSDGVVMATHPVPITAFAGLRDPACPPEVMAGWSAVTDAPSPSGPSTVGRTCTSPTAARSWPASKRSYRSSID